MEGPGSVGEDIELVSDRIRGAADFGDRARDLRITTSPGRRK